MTLEHVIDPTGTSGPGYWERLRDVLRRVDMVRYVDSVDGDDANDGRILGDAKSSVQAAYDSLPDPDTSTRAKGGLIIAAPGDYDVGEGVFGSKIKPVVVKPLIGSALKRQGVGFGPGDSHDCVLFYSSLTGGSAPTDLFNFVEPTSQVINGYGHTFEGVVFYLGDDVENAVYGENINNVRAFDCLGIGGGLTQNVEQYMFRGQVEPAHGDDCSWWRIRDNHYRGCGLAKIGRTDLTQNHNQHVIKGNDGLHDGVENDRAIHLLGNFRSVVGDNNIEGGFTSDAPYGIYLEACRQTKVEGDGGERVERFVYAKNSHGCFFAPLGASQASLDSDYILVTLEGSGGNTGADHVIIAPSGTVHADLYPESQIVELINFSATRIGPTVIAPVLNTIPTIDMGERADPSAPATGRVKFYARDNGSGKTQLVARFPTGAVQVVSTEP